MTAYYNEIDPYAAEWLRNLIAAGHIAHGVVDTRSIEDVRPDELAGYTQCHFFAGIGVWSRALRLAGWPDDRPVWTGSCPCQPFSAAGKGKGAADERHLWPAWQWLIAQCRPRVIFGEQVEAAIKHDWLDLVQADLEGLGYAVGAAGLPAAGVGAPHGRARLWFVAESDGGERNRVPVMQGNERDGEDAGRAKSSCSVASRSEVGELADRERTGLEGHDGDVDDRDESGWLDADTARPITSGGGVGGVADTDDGNASAEGLQRSGEYGQQSQDGLFSLGDHRPDATNGHWRIADWISCRDGKFRPVEPGTFPLAHGVAARVGKLRAYGNAIVPQVAEEVIRAYMDAHP